MVDDDGRAIARRRVGNDAAGFHRSCCRCWPRPATPPTTRYPWRSKPTADCGWRRCARPDGRSTRSTRWQPRATGHVIRSRGEIRCHDAVLLANILRIDPRAHRVLSTDTELAQAIRVLARARRRAVWARQQIGNHIRDLLKDFYPAALAAFDDLPEGGLARRDARTILAAAPTPAQAAKLTPARLPRSR